MSAEFDMSQYVELFLQEAEEQLEVLEQEMLKLEDDPSQDRLALIFRAAHTLKGSSRAMSFEHMAELTHEMENVLDQLRNNTISVNTEIADALLQCIDTLKLMVDSVREGTGDTIECKPLVLALQGFAKGEPNAVAVPVTLEKAPAQESAFKPLPHDVSDALVEACGSQTVYRALFQLQPDCVMKYVRAFMAISAVNEAGEILHTYPSSQDLEDENFETQFELYFHWTGDLESLKTSLENLSEVEKYQIELFTADKVENLTESYSETAVEEPANVVAPVSAEAVANVETAAVPAPAAAGKAPDAKRAESGQTVRVDVARLDALMNLVGELVIDRTRVAQIGSELANRFNDPNIEALGETVSHIARITSDLQDQIMKARMLPIETVFNRFPRVVRDLANKLGKEVKLTITGGETELDRGVIEAIGDPLLHILRNSIDHGLESPEKREALGKSKVGSVNVNARHQENYIVIEITDDGGGIDPDRIKKKAVEKGLISKEAADKLTDKESLQFIFASGLSTAEQVSEVSGRGVGMDIVRSNLVKLGGIIDLESEVGVGTKFSLRLPLTLAIIRGLLVHVSQVVYVVPLGNVIETLHIDRKSVQRVNSRDVVVIRGVTTPLVYLSEVFGTGNLTGKKRDQQAYVVIVGLAENRVGIVVDDLIGEQEVVIKSLTPICGEVRGISGATILGDGNVALIMDVNTLAESA